jgi:putative radical SAM enzyme (TIGR03279 family)
MSTVQTEIATLPAIGENNGVLILEVQPGSPAARLGIAAGDRLISLNRHQINDILDYWFHVSSDRLKVEWLTAMGEKRSASLKKPFDQRLGVELEPFEIRRCSNNCVFCFVHQLPRGMRRELYVKDEDYRLSFLYGNYITGTNLSPTDKQRITDYKLSPLFFSIHATRQDVREQLLVKRDIEPVLPMLQQLTSENIYIHAQVVLCPGVNDGEILRETVRDLSSLYPHLESIAVVPIGLTDHRQRLPQMQDVSPEYARHFIEFCAQIQQETEERIGYPLIFPSDEFFLIAEVEPPSYDQFPEIPQLANGVGMYYKFYQRVDELIDEVAAMEIPDRKVAAITTHMGEKVLRRLVRGVNERLSPLSVDLLCVTNSLFGAGITVTGLLPGKDFLAAIKANLGYDRYLIPANALRAWDKRFLDDMTIEELKEAAGAGIEIMTGGDTAQSFLEACLLPAS